MIHKESLSQSHSIILPRVSEKLSFEFYPDDGFEPSTSPFIVVRSTVELVCKPILPLRGEFKELILDAAMGVEPTISWL